MDDTDRRIVALLRENARRSFQDIGQHVHLSAPAVKRRVDRLEHDGVIRGYTAEVDAGAYGWQAEAFVDLYCEGRMPAESIKRAVEGEAGVVSAHTVAGEASALLHVMARDTQDLELCLERIRATDGISRTVTEVVLSTLFERQARSAELAVGRQPPGPAPGSSGPSRRILDDLGHVLFIGLAVHRRRAIGLLLRGERVGGRVVAVLAVAGRVDQLALGLLEALGHSAAALLDRAVRLVTLVVGAVASDPGGLGRGQLLLVVDETLVAVAALVAAPGCGVFVSQALISDLPVRRPCEPIRREGAGQSRTPAAHGRADANGPRWSRRASRRLGASAGCPR